MNPPTGLEFILDPERERIFRRRLREKKKMIEHNIQQIKLGAQLNREFENPAMMANQERITANVIHLADDRERAIQAYAHPAVEELNSCIIRPEMQVTTFELKPVMFQML